MTYKRLSSPIYYAPSCPGSLQLCPTLSSMASFVHELHTIRHSFSDQHPPPKKVRQQLYPLDLPFPTTPVHAVPNRELAQRWGATVYVAQCPPQCLLSLHDAILIHIIAGYGTRELGRDMRVRDGGCITAIDAVGSATICLTFGPPEAPRLLLAPIAWVARPTVSLLQCFTRLALSPPSIPSYPPSTSPHRGGQHPPAARPRLPHLRHAPPLDIWLEVAEDPDSAQPISAVRAAAGSEEV
ncbi:hypothetical protein EVG20_g11054 [Dentipellis fragilis]|uniref:Uncharacterized protein n=1 Tax=Dentipellis fragilis TaxID=205917 RepID=A0A4Y9XQ41_9AGAM|nr:hypothetical protein EVG20_g11054 [Dentipellis fragilis]